MSERIAKIRHELAESRATLNRVLDAVGDRWETQVYSDGLAWTVRQLANHLADADRGHNHQVMNIAEGNDVIPADFDVERYNRRTTEKTAEQTGEQARAMLDASREQLNTWLDTLDEEKLDRQGRHASLNVLTVYQILKVMCRHELDHARDIAAALGIEA